MAVGRGEFHAEFYFNDVIKTLLSCDIDTDFRLMEITVAMDECTK